MSNTINANISKRALALKISRERGITLELAQSLADRRLSARPPAKVQIVTAAAPTIDVRHLAKELVRTGRIADLGKAQIAAAAIARRLSATTPEPTEGPFEDPSMEVHVESIFAQRGGSATRESIRRELSVLFPSSTKRAPASPVTSPAGNGSATVKIDPRRLAKDLAIRKRIPLSEAQVIIDRQRGGADKP